MCKTFYLSGISPGCLFMSAFYVSFVLQCFLKYVIFFHRKSSVYPVYSYTLSEYPKEFAIFRISTASRRNDSIKAVSGENPGLV